MSRNTGRRKTGFTIVEVMIVIAITGLLFVGVIAGTGSSIARNRYNDSVQGFTQLLREQYSAVINTQISERGADAVCNTPDPDDVMSGGKISGSELLNYYNSDGSLKETSASGRGRTNCLVYGLIITLGGEDGGAVQVSSLIGKDIYQLAEEDPSINIDNLSDLELLQLSGTNNLAVYYENIKVNSGGSVNNLDCWVRTTGSSSTKNLKWGATIETTGTSDNKLNATILIFRSPKDGAVRTYIMDSAITVNGEVVDYAAINNMNDGKGYGLQNPGNGKCNGNIDTNTSDGHTNNTGYYILKKAGINNYISDTYFKREDLIICVGSEDTSASAGQRRMIRIVRDGHNTSAVELIDADLTDDALIDRGIRNPDGKAMRCL